MAEFFNTGLSEQQFLEQYWQKKPLLLRQAFENFVCPVSPDELAGLACEPEVESRLIREVLSSNLQWQVENGPFTEQDFKQLPDSHWTLLVQDSEKHLPDLTSILDPFRFIPDWRRDDLMISYAPINGSVGPHTDGYDVFLLQAEGHRRWQISDKAIYNPRLLPDSDLQILAEFEPVHQWDLSPGDILYLPPHFAHHGIALDNCMTFSIGFRAPKQVEIIDVWTNCLFERNEAQRRYSDKGLNVQQREHELSLDVVSNVKNLLKQVVEDADLSILIAVGRLVTETKPVLVDLAQNIMTDDLSVEQYETLLAKGGVLMQNPYFRFAWFYWQGTGYIFMAGDMYSVNDCSRQEIAALVENKQISGVDWQSLTANPAVKSVLCRLIADGGWYID